MDLTDDKTWLRIGDVARLVGVTTKTVRYYQQLGLLGEARRTGNGYRCFGADDVVRLQRIRRLQALGLSLEQIHGVLGQPDHEHILRDVLNVLRDGIDAQIAALHERRDRIDRLLTGPVLHVGKASPTSARMQEELRHLLPPVSDALWQHDEQFWALLDAVHGPEHYEAVTRALAANAAAHPEVYARLAGWAERFVALAALPADTPEVERLVEDVLQAADVLAMLQTLPVPATEQLVTDAGFADLLAETFSPAQRRVLDQLKPSMPGELRGDND